MSRSYSAAMRRIVTLFAFCLAIIAVAPAGAQTNVFINEIHYDNSGTDTGEAIEIAGPAGTNLSGWSLVLYNGATSASYNTRALAGTLADAGDGAGFLAESYPTNGIQNGAPDGVALVDDLGSVVQFLSYEGSFTAAEGPAMGMTSVNIGVSESSGTPAGSSLQLTGTGTLYEDFTWASAAANTFGNVNTGQSFGAPPPPPPPGPCDAGDVFIHEIQGAGAATECIGDTVTIEGVVVGDYEGPSPTLRGFYVQEEDADQDANPLTSEGIFVFHFSVDSVNVGDLVRVTGDAGEFQGQTQIGFPDSIEVLGSGYSVTPTAISLPLASDTALEAVEGMLVVAPQPLFVTEFFQLGRFGQVVVSSGDRLDQPTNVVAPGAAANALQAANDLNRLIIDDAENSQNPDPILFGRDGNELTASNTLRGGDTATDTVGVMTYTWAGNRASGNAYRLRPIGALDGYIRFEAANPRPMAAPDVGGTATVAGFNVLNYFTTIDDGPNACGPAQDEGCRGADTELEFERQRAKLLSALSMIDADVVGLIELENTPGANPEGDIADGLNESLGTGTYAAIDAASVGGGVVGPDAIRVGLIYKPSAVTPLGDPALLDFSLDAFGQDRSRTAVAQSFVENATGEVFTTVVNHFKSKSGSEIDNFGAICSTDPAYPDCDQGDGQGYFNATRALHAQELADWLATNPTGIGDRDYLIVGDLNTYGMEDPIAVLEAYDYVNLSMGPGSYSFVFDGQWGTLDYAFASPNLAPKITDAAKYHINADEPSVLDYNTNFKSARQIDILYAPDEYRTSDHDPVVIGLGMNSGFSAAANPDSLWPPNHKLRDVEVSGEDGDGAALQVEIQSVMSSEADSGLDPEDVPNDIVVTGDDSLKLRAERFSVAGRVYTIGVQLTDGNEVVFDATEVTVPHDRRRQK